MADRVLFVDLENIQKIDLVKVPGDVRVMIFYGMTQKKLPEELVVQAQPLGTRLTWIKMSGQGSNALDFHIAYYLGQEHTRNDRSECVILSGDTGFDPLIRHLLSLGRNCSRATSVASAFPKPDRVAESEAFSRLVMLLKKEKDRPVRPTGLSNKVKSWFPHLTSEKWQGLEQRLVKESIVVRVPGKSLTYNL